MTQIRSLAQELLNALGAVMKKKKKKKKGEEEEEGKKEGKGREMGCRPGF